MLTLVFSLGLFVFTLQESIAKEKNSDIENVGNRNIKLSGRTGPTQAHKEADKLRT